MAHVDGANYESHVCILSLSESILFKFYPDLAATKAADGDGHVASLYLRPRSLLIFNGDFYENLFHAIDSTNNDRIDHTILNARQAEVKINENYPRTNTRLSLTIRKIKPK